MIVSCPECSARYRLADGAIPAEGRAMRCAGCKNRWFEMGPEPDAAIAPPPEPQFSEPEADLAPATLGDPLPAAAVIEVQDEDEDEPARGHPVLKTLFAVALGAAFTAGAAAMWMPDLPALDLSEVPWLDELANPPKAVPNPLALTFSVDPQPVAGGRTLYALTGTLSNPTSRAQPVPPLEGRLEDPSGRIDYRWTVPPPVATLLPGQQVRFDASALGAPGERVTISH